ncbi:MAG: Ig-like domain-containing protein, partial [Anaerolineae bacterium]|nr:Ig-like domain-containing protein [Anaerolineae bacterium]
TGNMLSAQGGQAGIRLRNLGSARLVGNTAQGYISRGVDAANLGTLTALTNTLIGGAEGIYFGSASNGVLAGNVVSGASATGVSVQFVGNTEVVSNAITNNDVGLRFENGSSANPLTATFNLFTANITGVVFAGNQPGLNLSRNAIAGNTGAGIADPQDAGVLAECNWFGSPTGPSGDGPGIGDAVVGGNIDFKPWLASSDLNGICSVTLTAKVTVMAAPTIAIVGSSSVVTAEVADQDGNPVADGTVVTFTASLGGVDPLTATTVSGVATATVSSTVAGVATVTAEADGVSGSTVVTFVPGAPFTVTLVAVPSTLVVGNSSVLTATVTDQYGNAVADGTVVNFATTLGTLGNATVGTVNGEAVNTLNSTVAGVATVTATVGSLIATAQVTFTPGAPFAVTLTLSPSIIFANGISQSTAVATVTDQYGNPVPGVAVQFFASVGTFSPTSGNTGAGGSVTAALTSLVPAIENVFAVVSGVGFASAQATYVNLPASLAPLTGTLSTVTQALNVVRRGNLITYTIGVTNASAAQINNVLIYVPVPSGTSYESHSGGNFFSGSALLLSGEGGAESVFAPNASLNALTWSGNLAGGALHTVQLTVRVQVLEGTVTFSPKVFVDNSDTGLNLSSTVEVVAYKLYLPIVRRP